MWELGTFCYQWYEVKTCFTTSTKPVVVNHQKNTENNDTFMKRIIIASLTGLCHAICKDRKWLSCGVFRCVLVHPGVKDWRFLKLWRSSIFHCVWPKCEAEVRLITSLIIGMNLCENCCNLFEWCYFKPCSVCSDLCTYQRKRSLAAFSINEGKNTYVVTIMENLFCAINDKGTTT